MQAEGPNFDALLRRIEEKKEAFDAFYALLLAYNARFNLTAVTEREEVLHKHFLDSLAGEGFLKKNAVCAEVGSGAGFPSIPLKLVREDLKLTLIESTGKKCEFLRTAVRDLGLGDVEVVCGRAEELARQETYRERYDVCFARAVARLNTLSEYCLPLVKKGGMLLAYKSDSEEEYREVLPAFEILGGGRSGFVRYDLPDGYGARMLIYCEKKASTPQKFPRGRGLERRSPLK